MDGPVSDRLALPRGLYTFIFDVQAWRVQGVLG